MKTKPFTVDWDTNEPDKTEYYGGTVALGGKEYDFVIEYTYYGNFGTDSTNFEWSDKEPPLAKEIEEKLLEKWRERQ